MIAKTQSLTGSAAAVAFVFSISLALGAGASQALVTQANRPVVKSAVTNAPIVFKDERRLPQFDDAGAPVQPLFMVSSAPQPQGKKLTAAIQH